MPAPRTGRATVVLAVGVLVVLGAAVLARGGSAVDPEAVEAARASLEPSPTAVAEVSDALPAGRLVVRPDGVDGLRLGMGAAEVAAAGYVVRPTEVSGCRRVLPGLADTGPGEGVAGWLVADRVAMVSVDERAGTGSSFVGAGLGGRLDDLPSAGVRRSTVAVPVPWQERPVAVDVAELDADADVRVSFVDLDSDAQIDHVQVLAPAAARCGAAADGARRDEQAALPPLELTGWGGLRLGMTVEQARQVVSLQPDPVAAAGTTTPAVRSCRLLLADDEPGLVYLVVGDGLVRAVAVDAGRTDTGLVLGEPADRAAAAYPGLTTAYLDDRWSQGLSADWQLPGGTIRLSPAREQVALPGLDAVLTGPRPVVGLLQIGAGCETTALRTRP